ncbi:MAG: hypothetical protein ABJF77_08330 [Qipengyuania citrea]|nr:hypothetical protein [Qipengyuania citrea]MCD1591243.1 hypothetical protein [Qipengyuania citrea]
MFWIIAAASGFYTLMGLKQVIVDGNETVGTPSLAGAIFAGSLILALELY